MLGQHRRADDLGVERELQLRTVEVGEFAASPGRDGRHQVVNGSHSIGERSDGRVIGDVNRFGSDAVIVVLGSQCRAVTARDDDTGTLGARQEGDGAGNPAATSDHNHTLTLQGAHS